MTQSNRNRTGVEQCHNHIGGMLGEAIFKFLLKEKWIENIDEELSITDKGWEQLEIMGIDVNLLKNTKRKMINVCSESDHGIFHEHIGAHLGLLLNELMIEKNWLEKKSGKNMELTDLGIVGLSSLGVDIKKII